jgi:hypothetical protein
MEVFQLIFASQEEMKRIFGLESDISDGEGKTLP